MSDDGEGVMVPMTHTPEMRQLQESVGKAVDAYLRSIENRRIELGMIDVVREEGEYVTPDHFMTDWVVIAQFQNPHQTETEMEPIPMFGKSAATSVATTIGLASILQRWWD